jgi:hypothetical protein
VSTEDVGAAVARVVQAANRAAGVLEAHGVTAARHATLARAQAARVRERDLSAGRDALLARTREARAALDEVTAELVPGPLGARWDDPVLLEQAAGVLDVAEHVRCGAETPLVLPLLDRGSLRLVAGPERRDAAAGAVQEIVLRSLLGTGAGQLSLTTFDPRLSATTAMFTPLRRANEDVVRPALSTPDDLRTLMEALAGDVRRITDMYGGVPSTLGEFRRSTGQPIEHYRLVCVLDYPTGFDERLNALLLTLLRTGPACGISFLVHHDPSVPPPDGVDPAAVAAACLSVDLGSRTFPPAEGWTVRAGLAPPHAVVEPALAALTGRIRQAAAPRIDFVDLQPDDARLWSHRSVDGITAVVGRIGHEPIEITLGDEIEQKHNVLVTGAVGQGKSNLLMALVHSWAMRYSPDEIEFYLLDFRDGVSLYPLAAHGDNADWLPHARVLGLESDRSFGLAVLAHLVAEFDRRSRIIKPYGDNITRYRTERPDAVLPRIVVVVDEFQVLFEEDDAITSDALLALDRLARRGRGYGIHLVLASQTLSGITALLAKQDGIFSQFPIRLALHNSAAESRAVLAQDNTEAARLRYRGELVVNRDFGEVAANQRGVVAFADPERLREVRATLVSRAQGRPTPTVFTSSAPAVLAEHLGHQGRSGAPTALLGVTIGVEPRVFSVPFDDTPGRHLSVLGTGRRVDGSAGSTAADTLHAAAVSVAATARPGSDRFVVLDLLGPDDPSRPVVRDLVRDLARRGYEVVSAAGGEVTSALSAVEQEVAARRTVPQRSKLFVVGFGVDRLAQARVLDLSTGTTPVDGLHTVWREGSPHGVHLLGWWANVRLYHDHVGLEAQGLIDAVLVLKVPPDAVVDLFGPFVSWTGPDNRALARDVAADAGPTVVVPFGPPGGAT